MYSVVGQSLQRIDGLDKVTGQSRYAADLDIPGMLYLKVLRSKVAHAKVKAIDVSAALKVSGVVHVFTYADVPGENSYGIIVKDQPMLTDKIRFKGDAVALVAAESKEAAEAGARAVRVETEDLPPVYDILAALAASAPAIHPGGNILTVSRVQKGDVAGALESSAAVISRRYTTQRVEHCYIETEAGVAYMDGSTVVIKASTQNPHYDRKDAARVLGLPLHRVRIIQTATGGGFGGKLDISVQCFLGLAALKLGRPVKLVFDRQESFQATGKRHPFMIDYTSGAGADGKLTAIRVKIAADTGAYASYGPATLIRAAVHAPGPYVVPNVEIEAYCIYTNNPFSGAMRGFGTPQMAFAVESQMDLLAGALKLTPLGIRRRNILHSGDETATGQRLNQSVGIGKTMEAAWEKARQVMAGIGGEDR